ncbi:hypothetical protein Mgra_00007226 [Meloidogyne graminicola]|uniref:Uncharacterized protein n=1 Tax=Meloidogyne graminicola TaxID=189291 RepID=A0A8S9ZJH2_9BILA|nr:hypothetical protein Mgra_00007226 [Meloidogyne graminicola]
MNNLQNQQYSSSFSSQRGLLFPLISFDFPVIINKIKTTEQRKKQQQNKQLHNNRRNYCFSSSLFAAIFTFFCVFAAYLPSVAGLACYETVNGKITIVQNDAWRYCALVPATIVGKEMVNGSQFGIGPENDMLGMYNNAFAFSQEEYRILTVCIYERYDFSRFLTMMKPDLAVEFAFRCVCNYDLCNSEPTFSAYLSAIKSESFARR